MYMPSHEINFVLQVVATLIGVFGGLAGALWHDRKKRKEETKNKTIQTINSILVELKENQKGLAEHENTIVWNEPSEKFDGEWGLASIPAYESSVSSGNFLLINTELQSPISTTYHEFQIWNQFMKQVMDFATYKYPQAQINVQAQTLLTRLSNTRSNLQKKLDDLIPKLENLNSELENQNKRCRIFKEKVESKSQNDSSSQDNNQQGSELQS